MTYFLIALASILAVLLFLQQKRTASNIRRLSEAMRKHDRQLLGGGRFHRSTDAFRTLEREIFEQLFESESLEQKISRREDLITTVVEGLSDAILVFDWEMKIRFTNRSACKLFNWNSPPLDRHVKECIRDPKLLEAFENAVTHHQQATFEITHQIPGSESITPLTLEVDVAPLTSTESHSVTRARAVLHDITESRTLDQVRRDFVANASHELRTPLTIINGYLENLEESRISDRDSSIRFISVMHKHGKRIARIIEDMLTISKLESRTQEAIQCTSFNFLHFAQEVIDRLKPMFDEKKATYTLDIKPEASINGDTFYWDQILFNLIENALKENDAGALSITVGLEHRETTDIITVTDDGVGIPATAQEFIFKRFYRVDQNRGSEKKGTGLGLSIVKRAVEAHGGEIDVQSTPGVETTFAITLPRQKELARQS
ncbi:MAG: hypothetical protein GY899_14120 [Verrucomicrobiaceae bacterium]|nr:hypothetical protein [Verrucomicrobiaceae bacterium]